MCVLPAHNGWSLVYKESHQLIVMCILLGLLSIYNWNWLFNSYYSSAPWGPLRNFEVCHFVKKCAHESCNGAVWWEHHNFINSINDNDDDNNDNNNNNSHKKIYIDTTIIIKHAFWLTPVTWIILGYMWLRERRKCCVVFSWQFLKMTF